MFQEEKFFDNNQKYYPYDSINIINSIKEKNNTNIKTNIKNNTNNINNLININNQELTYNKQYYEIFNIKK
jgi:hypothetical protein